MRDDGISLSDWLDAVMLRLVYHSESPILTDDESVNAETAWAIGITPDSCALAISDRRDKFRTTLPAFREVTGIGNLNPEQVPVPGMLDVYFCPEVDNFYSRSKRRGMGDAFYRQHIHLMRKQ